MNTPDAPRHDRRPAGSPPAGAQADRPAGAELDLRCTDCAYSLRGLRLDGNCPECGTPIASTVAAYNAGGAPRDWIVALLAGTELIVGGFVALTIAVGSALLALIIAPAAPLVAAAPWTLAGVLTLIGGGEIVLGFVDITKSGIRAVFGPDARRAASLARIGDRIFAAGFVVALALSCAPRIAALPAIVAIAAGMIVIDARVRFVRALAQSWNWTEVSRASRRARLAMAALASVLLIAGAAAFISGVGVGTWAPFSDAWSVLRRNSAVTAFVSLILVALVALALRGLFERFRRRLRDVVTR